MRNSSSARIHKHARDRITNDEIYKTMRKEWRKEEQEYADIHLKIIRLVKFLIR